ncbi:class I SAM-dependent methyltransferase [Chryseobacterium sp. A321]
MIDLPGRAILDYFQGNKKTRLYVHDRFGPRVEMPISMYFRGVRAMPELELKALEQVKGEVLEIGAGAGSHALELQTRGCTVHALEISPSSCDVMTQRGVKTVICEDVFEYSAQKYDTLLLLMNGIGLCGSLEGFDKFLQKAESLLRPGGQIVFDSSDIDYMYAYTRKPSFYYGQVECAYQYGKEITPWFHWLYIDFSALKKRALSLGWNTEFLFEDEHYQYLAKLTRLSES